MKRWTAFMLVLVMMLGSLCINVGETDVKAAEDKVKQGDIIVFGHYEQDNDLTNGKEPIEWIVLDVDGDEALLLSKYALDCKPYNEMNEAITWENCTLRKWLNNEFYNTAFSDNEKKQVNLARLVNKDNLIYGTDGGNDTKDNVFLLSFDDMVNKRYGFSRDRTEDDIARRCTPTTYAVVQGASVYKTAEGECRWWLRSLGDFSVLHACVLYRAIAVFSSGGLSIDGDSVSFGDAVRPALYLNLQSYQSSNRGNKPNEEKNQEVLSSVKQGDEITFGRYEQDNDLTNGKEPIEWIVLSIKEDKALLLSKYALDCKAYNEENKDMTWENCTLRNWLNDDFYNSVFSDNEKLVISITNLENKDNPEYGTDGGNNTYDRVFLLSLDEIVNTEYGFSNDCYEEDIERRCAPTAYAAKNGAWPYSGDYEDGKKREGLGTCRWWLRSPGKHANCAARMDYNGNVFSYSNFRIIVAGYNDSGAGVRPALYLDLKSYKSSNLENDTDPYKDGELDNNRKTLGKFRPKITVKNGDTNTQAILNIGKASYADGYYIYLKKDGENGYKKTKQLEKNGKKPRKVVINNLEEGIYYIKVTAYHQNGTKKELGKPVISNFTFVKENGNTVFYYQDEKIHSQTFDTTFSKLLKTDATKYNPEMAELLVMFAYSAYNQENIEFTQVKKCENGQYFNLLPITQTLISFGFKKENILEKNYYKTSDDKNYGDNKVAYTIAAQKNGDEDIVVISLRGSWGNILNLTSDWKSNFFVQNITKGDHIGFRLAADDVISNLKEFEKSHSIKRKKTNYIITGHSRAAAVGNFVAKYLVDAGVSNKKVYAYNFACPDNRIDAPETWNPAGKYDNIFNINNIRDIVGIIPGGFASFINLSNMINSKSIKKMYWGKCGRTYFISDEWENITDIPMEWSDFANGDLPRGMVRHDPKYYADILESEPDIDELKTWEEARVVLSINDMTKVFKKIYVFLAAKRVRINLENLI